MKGVLQKDHIPVNKYQMLIVGLPPLTFTEISGIEQELETVDLPDRTVASGGNKGTVEFTAMQPAHHLAEVAAIETWFNAESTDPVSGSYKKDGTVILQSISGNVVKTHSILGMFPSKKALPDLEMANEGEMAAIEWTFKADEVLPI